MGHRYILLLCIALTLPAIAADNTKRAADRQARMNLLKTLPDAQKKITANYLNLLATDGQWLLGLQDKADAATIVAEIESLDPQQAKLAELKKGVEGIAEGKALDELKQKEM